MRSREEQDRLNRACLYHPQNRKMLERLLSRHDVSPADVDTSKITDMSCLFEANYFNPLSWRQGEDLKGIENWDVSHVTSMESMFSGHILAFAPDLNGWDVSKVKDFSGMFNGCVGACPEVSSWDVSSCRNFARMFCLCDRFNSDLSGWNVSRGEDFTKMFSGCERFQSDLSRWDVSNGRKFEMMFRRALVFNSDLSGWKLSKAEDTSMMFAGAENFCQDLLSWQPCLKKVRSAYGMFDGCGCDELDFMLPEKQRSELPRNAAQQKHGLKI